MKKTYHVVSFSGGKDSTAMLLHMLELGMPIDEVVNVDTGMEFPAMYRHIEKVRAVVETAGVKFTTLKADKTFKYYLKRAGIPGCSWSGRSQWCTRVLKIDALREYTSELSSEYCVMWYLGIAADETARLVERKHNNANDHKYPLIEWGWTDADCLKHCYENGYDWGGLYKLFKSLSCSYCPLQSLEEFRNLRRHFPDLWSRLFELDAQICHPHCIVRVNLAQLEVRFALEDERDSQGLTISARSSEFKSAIAERLEGR